ncbi:MAG: cell division protein FtsQ/DivIB [Cyclobacteriaceae bacterium]|nr:cell division protein FtsQ/DivIB [Cyclobacteriaceae bacterium]
MFKRFKIAKSVKVLLSVMILFFLIAFANREYGTETCNNIFVTIENQHENYYIDKQDVINLLNHGGDDVIIGKPFYDINLKEIENRILTSPYVKETEVFKDLKGNLIVKANLRRPIARIIRSEKKDAYISEEGEILPVTNKFNSRVVLISGKGGEEVIKAETSLLQTNPALFKMIKFINKDNFWKAQIAQIEISENREVIIYPQITKQYVEFGQIEDIEEKFKKLKIFYKRILPLKGWNYYEKVNLKYEGQIIAD